MPSIRYAALLEIQSRQAGVDNCKENKSDKLDSFDRMITEIL